MQSPVCLVDKIETALRDVLRNAMKAALRGVLRDVAKGALRGALIALRGR